MMRFTLLHRESSRESDAPLEPSDSEAIRRAAVLAIASAPGNLQTVFAFRATNAQDIQQFVQLRADLYQAIAVTCCESHARLALSSMSALLDQSKPAEARRGWKVMLEALVQRTRKQRVSVAVPLPITALHNVPPIA